MASIGTQSPGRVCELDASVVNTLQSQTFLNSHAQVIKRLVTQAVSRNATSIKIIVDKTWSNIAFYDNGCSIDENYIKKYIKDANEDNRSTTLSLESALVFHAKRIQIKIVSPLSVIHLIDNKLKKIKTDKYSESYNLIELFDLFYRWPVRRKHAFLSRETTNTLTNIVHSVNSVMIARPRIGIQIVDINDNLLLAIKAGTSAMDRFMQVCPRISLETVKSCKKLAISDYTFELTFSSRSESRAMNYVTKRDGYPGRKRSLQDMFIESQYICINAERFSCNEINNTINDSIENLYKNSSLNDRGFVRVYPFLLLIECESYLYEKLVDGMAWNVNGLSFIDEEKFYKALCTYLKALGLYNETNIVSPMPKKVEDVQCMPRTSRIRSWRRRICSNEKDVFSVDQLYRNFIRSQFIPQHVSSMPLNTELSVKRDTVVDNQDLRITKEDLKLLKYIGQFDKKFLICLLSKEKEDGTKTKQFIALDQHAADERIQLEMIFEQYNVDNWQNSRVKKCTLKTPVKIQISATDAISCRQHSKTFHRWKFLFVVNEHLGAKNGVQSLSVSLLSVPLIEGVKMRAQSDFLNFLEALKTNPTIAKNRPPFLLRTLQSKACRSAVMFGDTLSFAEGQNLISKLSECSLPFICAHGRPTIAPI